MECKVKYFLLQILNHVLSYFFLYTKFTGVTIFALLRPHTKVSYRMSVHDMETIITDMKAFKAAGVAGFSFGALKADRTIDKDACCKVIETAGGLPVMFNRAFDMTSPARDQLHANIATLNGLGFKWLLSSGFCRSASNGLPGLAVIHDAIKDTSSNLILIPVGAITLENITEIIKFTRCVEYHVSVESKKSEQLKRFENDADFIRKVIDGNFHYQIDCRSLITLVGLGKSHLVKKLC